MEKKYSLSEVSPDEQKTFKDKFDALANEMSLYISFIVQKKSLTIKGENGASEMVFVDVPMMVVQKKIEIVEPEVV